MLEVPLRQVSRCHALAIEIDDLREALEILLRELERRLGEQGGDERLLRLKAKLPLEVDHGLSRHLGRVVSHSRALRTLTAALERIAERAGVAHGVLEEVQGHLPRGERRQAVSVEREPGIGSEGGGRFVRFRLRQSSGAVGPCLIALNRQPHGVVHRDAGDGRGRRGRLWAPTSAASPADATTAAIRSPKTGHARSFERNHRPPFCQTNGWAAGIAACTDYGRCDSAAPDFAEHVARAPGAPQGAPTALLERILS